MNLLGRGCRCWGQDEIAEGRMKSLVRGRSCFRGDVVAEGGMNSQESGMSLPRRDEVSGSSRCRLQKNAGKRNAGIKCPRGSRVICRICAAKRTEPPIYCGTLYAGWPSFSHGAQVPSAGSSPFRAKRSPAPPGRIPFSACRRTFRANTCIHSSCR